MTGEVPEPAGKRRLVIFYVILAVMRSDLRALVRFLSRRAADVIADGLEHELLGLPATETSRHQEELTTRARHLRGRGAEMGGEQPP